jgi:RNA polymerase sigma-70 factor, ECF subfamily
MRSGTASDRRRRGAGAAACGMTGAATSFEPHRRHLTGLAYRLLGSRAEAEDAVQEAYLRWHAVDQEAVENPRAFLSKIVTRLCLDLLKSARARRES